VNILDIKRLRELNYWLSKLDIGHYKNKLELNYKECRDISKLLYEMKKMEKVKE